MVTQEHLDRLFFLYVKTRDEKAEEEWTREIFRKGGADGAIAIPNCESKDPQFKAATYHRVWCDSTNEALNKILDERETEGQEDLEGNDSPCLTFVQWLYGNDPFLRGVDWTHNHKGVCESRRRLHSKQDRFDQMPETFSMLSEKGFRNYHAEWGGNAEFEEANVWYKIIGNYTVTVVVQISLTATTLSNYRGAEWFIQGPLNHGRTRPSSEWASQPQLAGMDATWSEHASGGWACKDGIPATRDELFGAIFDVDHSKRSIFDGPDPFEVVKFIPTFEGLLNWLEDFTKHETGKMLPAWMGMDGWWCENAPVPIDRTVTFLMPPHRIV